MGTKHPLEDKTRWCKMGGVYFFIGPVHFVLRARYRPEVVRAWGRGHRLTDDSSLAKTFSVSGAWSGRAIGQRARGVRQKVEAKLNVPLEVVWLDWGK